jgi:hypothetical protein
MMATFKFTVKNFVPVDGKLKQKIVYRFIDADSESEARRKLDLYPKLILKCQNYEHKTKPSNQPTN